MSNDVAVFLDLDNLVIGAKQVKLSFDINLVLDHLKKITDGRIVLRHAYGAGRQSRSQLQELAQAGFIVQSATRINSFSKNLADMQIVVNAMDTLVDGHQYSTYVLMSGDRDFTPLVQSLRKRGKRVIGVGIRHTSSSSLIELCDHYIFYEDLLTVNDLTDAEIEALVSAARDKLLHDKSRVRASIFKEEMTSLSDGRFSRSSYPQASFSKFLQGYPHLVRIIQEESTTYVAAPGSQEISESLANRYRAALKRQRMRIVPAQQRFAILHALITLLRSHPDLMWYELLKQLNTDLEGNENVDVSKNQINALLLVARQAGVIRTLKGKSLSTAPVVPEFSGDRAFQESVICIDKAYLGAILDLPELFDYAEAAVALYDSPGYESYLRRIIKI
ncbi:MAG: NYN domain-containing protein [Candidatus Promineifilaceae bacterium]|jgi:uncharacterized LabA/DUF88 family protein